MSDEPRGVLAFAPDGYFVEAKKNDRWRAIPESLAGEMKTSKGVFCMAIGTNNNFFVSWKDTSDKQWKCHALGDYPGLSTYLNDEERKKKFEYTKFHVALGPNGSFYFNNDGTGQHHNGLDARLKKEINRRLNDKDQWPFDPVDVALGFDGSYVLLGKKGDIFWDLKGHYPDLEKRLMEAKFGLKHIVLSPFNGKHWNLVWKNGSAEWQVEDEWTVKRYE